MGPQQCEFLWCCLGLTCESNHLLRSWQLGWIQKQQEAARVRCQIQVRSVGSKGTCGLLARISVGVTRIDGRKLSESCVVQLQTLAAISLRYCVLVQSSLYQATKGADGSKPLSCRRLTLPLRAIWIRKPAALLARCLSTSSRLARAYSAPGLRMPGSMKTSYLVVIRALKLPAQTTVEDLEQPPK